jgi:hypothetical protein
MKVEDLAVLLPCVGAVKWNYMVLQKEI